ncbi:MAG: ABC transporter permease [Nitrososphaerota archaeon]|nr:ABC transporter permease [Nitrososphaerota archaeon]MDG6937865.1 ABC transporter permease [Nitrososphaerota archaeon]MDG6958824.1 ABC transporter permease [Nitrososphaerota archaeon]MDG6962090.1 ABC transporter permease [Nitrososphaerota archaeon]MDG6962867.1 ABC transporter permease [Nitrososphaerota archaeon]
MRAPDILRLVYRNVVVNTDYGTLIILVGLPALYLVFFGYGFQSLAAGASHSYLDFLAPGIVSFQTVMAGIAGGSMLWADRRWGMLAQLLVGPFSRLQYLLGIMLTSVVFGFAGAAVMMVAAYLLTGSLAVTAAGALMIVGAILVGSILFGSLMLYISALVKSNNAYNSIQVLIIFVVNFASTVFYSISPAIPAPLRALFLVNPLTYLANIVRDGYMGRVTTGDLYQLLGVTAVMLALLTLAVRSYMRSGVSFS